MVIRSVNEVVACRYLLWVGMAELCTIPGMAPQVIALYMYVCMYVIDVALKFVGMKNGLVCSLFINNILK